MFGVRNIKSITWKEVELVQKTKKSLKLSRQMVPQSINQTEMRTCQPPEVYWMSDVSNFMIYGCPQRAEKII